jgi:hypothetical protein
VSDIIEGAGIGNQRSAAFAEATARHGGRGWEGRHFAKKANTDMEVDSAGRGEKGSRRWGQRSTIHYEPKCL